MKYALTLLLGLILGGALIYFFLVGAPRAAKPPGEVVRAPEAGGPPPGTAVLTLDEQFFNTLLGTIFRDMGPPTFQLASGGAELIAPADEFGARYVRTQGGGCASQVVVAPEGSGVKTGVRLAEGAITAPLAFSGSYGVIGQCVNFRGWGQANIDLRFDREGQTLYGQINVQSVTLEGVSPLFGGLVTGFVQNAINQRVNPIVLMRGQQLSLAVPVQATGGTLRAQAREVRSEVRDGALRINVTYDFTAERGQQQQEAPPAPPG